jgi:hypothetical protein
MKTITKILIIVLFSVKISNGQVISVLNIDTKAINVDPEQMGNITRLELEKLKLFEVVDKYEAVAKLGNDKIQNCFGKTCLMEAGEILKADKMLSGSVEKVGNNIIFNFRLIDVKTGTVEKTQLNEFLNLPHEIQRMTRITIREMFGMENDNSLVQTLTQKQAFENPITEPDTRILKLDGPRMGATIFTGTNAAIVRASSRDGGYNRFPVFSQIGYQFEKQYLNEGDFQALVELIPMISGMDQGLFIPSFTVLNGIRSNSTGWEIALGPTMGFVRVAPGYYQDNKWVISYDEAPADASIEKRMDSRGNVTLRTGFVIAFGKSFRSGKMNLPVNGYIIPGRDGMRVGVSFGFNARK